MIDQSAHTIELTEGGLSFCPLCGGAEGSLPAECPKARMHPLEEQRVYAGGLNFIKGRWQVERPRSGALVIRLTALPLPGISVGVDPWHDPIADRARGAA